jgi:Trk K+ transport system NAD-binding subunit
LNPNVRIVSRITHERNLEAIHRAGADFVLSYAPIGAESLMSLIQGRASVIMGEDIEFSNIALPPKLAGKTLKESHIGERTGLIVLAVDDGGTTTVSPGPDHVLGAGSRLNVLGTTEQLTSFRKLFN